jgi:hypothetical protein
MRAPAPPLHKPQHQTPTPAEPTPIFNPAEPDTDMHSPQPPALSLTSEGPLKQRHSRLRPSVSAQTLVEKDESLSITDEEGSSQARWRIAETIPPVAFYSTPGGFVTGGYARELVLKGLLRRDEIEPADLEREVEPADLETEQSPTKVDIRQINLQDEMFPQSTPDIDEGIDANRCGSGVAGHLGEGWTKPPPLLF